MTETFMGETEKFDMTYPWHNCEAGREWEGLL